MGRHVGNILTPGWYTPSLAAPPVCFEMVWSVDVALALGQWGRRAHRLPPHFHCSPPEPPGLQSASECQC